MIRTVTVLAALALATAAAPQGPIDTSVAPPKFTLEAPAGPVVKRKTPPGFTAAPMPNIDAAAPAGPRATNDAQLSPSFIQRSNQYRGEGLSSGSSTQSQQERRVQPGAGVNLRVPLQ